MNKDKETSDITKILSHELRTPLTSIRGFAQTIINSYDQLCDDQKIKFLKIIEEQSQRLINIIENILTISSSDQKDNIFIYKSFLISNVIENIYPILKMKYKTHRFEINKCKNEPYVYADINKTQQVFVNIIENACKYSHPNSTVEIDIKANFNEDYIIVSVKDQGIGIASDKIDLIFEKFVRLENPLTQVVEGSGLGLYIAKSIINRMGGKIIVKNLKKGTSFEVWLKLANYNENLKNKLKENT